MSVLRLTFVAVLQATPAVAEVCDKVVGDGWTRDQGPVGALTWHTGAVLLSAFAAVVFLIARLRSRTLARIAALGAFALALLIVSDVVFPDRDPIWEAAIEEGCSGRESIPATLVRVSLYLIAAAFFLWMARRRTAIR